MFKALLCMKFSGYMAPKCRCSDRSESGVYVYIYKFMWIHGMQIHVVAGCPNRPSLHRKKRNTPRAPLDLCEVPACTKDLWGCWGYRRQCYAIIKNLDLLKIRFALHKITIEWPRSIIWAIWKYDLFLEAPNQQVASYDGAFPRTKPQTIGLFCFINLFCFRTESNLSNRTGVFV
jgi:hypothetical protein